MNQPVTQRITIPPQQLWRILCVVLGVITFSLCAYIATHVLLSYPASMDEFNFLYQAQIYARGKFFLNVEPYHKELAEMWMLTHNGHYFSKYPPGFSFILSAGVRAGVPELINPLISALAIITIACMVAQIHTYFIGFIAALFLLTNSYYLGYASSLYGHVLCVLLTAAAFYFFACHVRKASLWRLHYAGICIGLMVFARPVDAAAVIGALSIGLLLEHKKQAVKPLIFIWVPVIVALLLFMSFNYYLRDCFCLATYRVWSTPEFHIIADKQASFLENATKVVKRYLQNGENVIPHLFTRFYIPYIGYGYLAILALGFLRPWSRMMQISLIHILAIVAFYNFNHTDGYPMYGARYWYVTLVSQSVFFAGGLLSLFTLFKRRYVLALCALLISVQLYQVYEDMYVYWRRAAAREIVLKDIKQKCPEKSFVRLFVHERIAYWPRFFWLLDYKRNPFFKGPRFYLFPTDDTQKLLKHYPNYRVCTYTIEDFRDGVHFLPPYRKPLLNYDLRYN